MGCEDCEAVGIAEIAERLGVKRGLVDVWRHRKTLPPHRWLVSGNPAWDWLDILEWAKATGRLTDSTNGP